MILEPGEPHTGGPVSAPGFVYRVMYPAPGLLSGGSARPPRFREPVVRDPALAGELRSVHAMPSRAAEPLEMESRLLWLLAALVRRHASPAPSACEVRGAGEVASQVMTRLADQLTCPPALAEIEMTRRGWVLFAVMCVVWGIPYLLIKVAVGGVSVPVVVFARTALGAVALFPLALRSGHVIVLRRHLLTRSSPRLPPSASSARPARSSSSLPLSRK